MKLPYVMMFLLFTYSCNISKVKDNAINNSYLNTEDEKTSEENDSIIFEKLKKINFNAVNEFGKIRQKFVEEGIIFSDSSYNHEPEPCLVGVDYLVANSHFVEVEINFEYIRFQLRCDTTYSWNWKLLDSEKVHSIDVYFKKNHFSW